jgi:hypothetical protein
VAELLSDQQSPADTLLADKGYDADERVINRLQQLGTGHRFQNENFSGNRFSSSRQTPLSKLVPRMASRASSLTPSASNAVVRLYPEGFCLVLSGCRVRV